MTNVVGWELILQELVTQMTIFRSTVHENYALKKVDILKCGVLGNLLYSNN